MKAKEIRDMNLEDINSKLLELRKEMIKYNAQIAAGTSIKSPALVKNTKKTIAKLIQEKNKRGEQLNG